ncbi:hypothetical protein A7982_13949 [Minicystis rosea]|nr:hypothetical protein A7982_13949 [Minicystis rosea]
MPCEHTLYRHWVPPRATAPIKTVRSRTSGEANTTSSNDATEPARQLGRVVDAVPPAFRPRGMMPEATQRERAPP